jgi:carbon starvation protein
MMPIILTGLALGSLLLGYRFYSRFLAETVFDLQSDEPVPADTMADGVDFVKTPRHVLWGHHFSSIAGAAPILGPAIAIVWGYVPALIWIVVGVIFMGATHDFGALVLSMRHKGQTVGKLTENFIGPKARTLFLTVIFFLIWMVGAVFAFAIAGLFCAFPASILPVNLEILVAVGIGWWGYRYKGGLLIPSIVALVGLYLVIFGTATGALWVPEKDSIFLSKHFWLWALMIYGFIASSLPVWLLLQPRDLINSHQLVVGLVALYLGFLISRPDFQAPAIGELDALPAVIPLLFVTIACGAISGFHGLVSSGTTSKQLNCAKDARPIGYGAMLGEASLAILATMAVATGLWASSDAHDTAWQFLHSHTVEKNGSLPTVSIALQAFVNGAASFLHGLGIPTNVGITVVAVLVISFAATSLDTALRIQRLVIGELGQIYRIQFLENRWIGGILATGSVMILVYADYDQGAKSLWPVFGATNQILAAFTLLLCALYLKRSGRRPLPYIIPAIFVMGITFAAMGVQVFRDLAAGNWLVGCVGLLIAILTLAIAIYGGSAWRNQGLPSTPESE